MTILVGLYLIEKGKVDEAVKQFLQEIRRGC